MRRMNEASRLGVVVVVVVKLTNRTAEKMHKLVSLDREELLTKLKETKEQLASLRVTQAADQQSTKLMEISSVRKLVARILTRIRQLEISASREVAKGKKYQPKDLRKKLTKALRLRPSVEDTHVRAVGGKGQTAKKLVKRTTLRQAKKAANFKPVAFAVKPE